MTGAKFDIKKFDGTDDFGFWRIKMRTLLFQHGCEAALEVLPADMEAQTKAELNKKAHSAVILCLGNKVIREVTGETPTSGVWLKLKNLYMTKALANKLRSIKFGRGLLGIKCTRHSHCQVKCSHWQYKFPLPVKVVATARRLEMPLPEVCTAIEEKKKKLPVKDRWQLHYVPKIVPYVLPMILVVTQKPFYRKQAQQKQHSLYNVKVLLEKHDPPAVYDSNETLELAQESRLKMKQLNKEIKPANYTKINHILGAFVSQMAKSREELYFSNTSKTANVPKSILIPNEEFSDDATPMQTFGSGDNLHWQWELILPVGTLNLAVGMPCAFYSQQLKAHVRRVQRLVQDQFRTPLAKVVAIPASRQGTLQENLKSQAQKEEIVRLKERVKVLEDKEDVAATQSRDDAPIKGRSINEGEATAERISNNSKEIARVLTSMDAATVLAGGIDVPIGSGFIPTAGPPATVIPTSSGFIPTAGPPATIISIGSEVGPTASPIVIRRKGMEVMVDSDTPKKKKLQE
nr:retrovirus-related Pol polyprotein from transposon TNT 1-94 [Tanacetum cinerariifolium]